MDTPTPARAPAPPPAADASRRVATVLIARRVAPASVAAFEAAMQGMLAAAEGFAGHLGGQLMRPEDSGTDGEDRADGDPAEPLLYHVVFAFDSEAHLAAWQASPERAQQLHRVTGLDYWFATPHSTTRPAPPRWKVATVTWLGIFPTVLLLFLTVAPLLA